MLSFNTNIFQANQGAYAARTEALSTEWEMIPVWGEPVVAPDYQDLQDTFAFSSCGDYSLNAMRDLARQMQRMEEPAQQQTQSTSGTGKHHRQPKVDQAQPKASPKTGKVSPAELKAMSQDEKYDYYKAMIEEHGGKFRNKPGQRNLLSIRHDTNTHSNHNQGRYDDVTVMLWTDKKGGKHVRRYRSNTEPSARYQGQYGKDGDRDGRLDQARMKAGYNEYYMSKSDHLGNVLRPSRATRGELDINHDGRFDKKDGKHRFTGGDYSMLFHAGGDTSTGSAGCQTMPPKVFDRFWRDLSAGRQGRIGYTIVEAG
ncbi:MAG: hypothetical protein U0931_00090 [Vulcanimicrobiota bacterium]